MALSSSCLIHFTAQKDALKQILVENFRIKYCRERPRLESHTFDIRVPMVSFCDIPLSQIKNHLASYGCYGIGLTKDWAKENGLNPVMYLEQRSALSRSLLLGMRSLVKHGLAQGSADDEFMVGILALQDIFRHVKNYEGTLIRMNGASQEDYRFSDEREWRFVPEYDHRFGVLRADSDPELVDAANAWLDGMRLFFEPKDIKYIIVKDESEIHEFIEHLRYAKGDKYTQRDVERLTTRIVTAEQIRTDV